MAIELINNNIDKNSLTALITQIERGAVYDGTGLRTVIFFKGCNFNCGFCYNGFSYCVFYNNKILL